jgi:AraC-like DNA-binding protein
MITRCFQAFEAQNLIPGSRNGHPLVLTKEGIYFLGFSRLTATEYLIFGPAAQSRSYRLFANAFSIAILLYSKNSIPPEDIILSNAAPLEQEMETGMQERLFFQREQSISHTPQSYELGVLQAVEAGDLSLLKRRLVEPVDGRVGQMTKNPVLQERYTFIAFATLLTRAAIRGGLNSETAFSFSDTCCQQMDSMTRLQDISALLYKMAIDFCQKVAREGKPTACSSKIQKIRSYISTHLHEEIHLAELSATSNLCSRSLSIQFRKELGISVADYIHQQKMREAAHLLLHSDYDIAGIAGFLNYNSQSYFTKVFHDVYGLTPKQYREKQQGKGYYERDFNVVYWLNYSKISVPADLTSGFRK